MLVVQRPQRGRSVGLHGLVALWVVVLLASACAQDPPALDPRCEAGATAIHAVQGDGPTSPLENRRTTVQGVVTAAFQGDPADPFRRDLGGIYLHTPGGEDDGDPATSEGLFVETRAPAPAPVGALVRVSGTVVEAYGMTTLTGVREVVDCGVRPGPPAPTALRLPVDPADLEALEGMPVRLPQALVIAEYFDYDRFGEIVLALPQDGLDRPLEATQRFAPTDPRAAAWEAAQDRRRIVLDDGRNDQNPSPVRHPNGEVFTLENRFRGGDVVRDATGMLHYAYGDWRVHPTAPAEHLPRARTPSVPPAVGAADGTPPDVVVAAMNVQNYFVDVGDDCGPSGGMDCRGADDARELDRQRAKLVAALAALDADVLALVELQNAPDDRAAADLAAGLRAATGAPWRHVAVGAMGTDAIAQAILYRPDVVAPVGTPAVLDDVRFTDPRATGRGKNRPALAWSFAPARDGHESDPDPALDPASDAAAEAAVTIVVNHLKSKGSSCGPGDDGPLQGSCAGTRTDGVRALLAWLAQDPTGVDAPWLVLGDLNAYPKEDPIAALLAGPDGAPATADDPVDLLAGEGVDRVTTFVFDGRFGRLDHAVAHPDLVTRSGGPRVTGAAVWPINAPEVDLIDYDLSYKGPAEADLYAPDPFRASDHDPVRVGLAFDGGRAPD